MAGSPLARRYRRFFKRNAVWDVVGLYSIKNYKSIEVGTRTRGPLAGKWTLACARGLVRRAAGRPISARDRVRDDRSQLPAAARLVPGRRDSPADPGAAMEDRRGLRSVRNTGEGHGPPHRSRRSYTPATAPGLFADPTFIRTEATGRDRLAPVGRLRAKGGFYGVTLANFADPDDTLQLRPARRRGRPAPSDAARNWVISLRGRVQTTLDDDDVVPYFLLPQLGSGSTLRGYSSGRFRDRHSLLTSAEFRWIPNRLALDMALFYDAGKVDGRRDDLDFEGLEERLRYRRAVPRPDDHGAADRSGAGLRWLAAGVCASSAAF